jgi:hypothetical protein
MDHPGVLECAAWTADCARNSRAMDDRLAAWGLKLMEMLSDSRRAIARSRHFLTEIDDRDGR